MAECDDMFINKGFFFKEMEQSLMIRIMYANHCVGDDYISNLYESKVT
jgi:hypothetical protein